MRPLALEDPVAAIAFWASFGAWFSIELAVGARTRSKRDLSLSLVIAAMLASIAAGAVLAGRHVALIAGPAWWPVATGLALMWVGVAFRQWSIATLGRFFTMDVQIHEGHAVIAHGPYRWLRHPSYSGGLAIVVGLGLAEGSWVSLAVTAAVPLAAYVLRMRVEERALLEELGEEYAAYMRRTARLVPGLY
ncbi:MAG: methyltransferase family protein [Solirubrobacteraceae bacterium]